MGGQGGGDETICNDNKNGRFLYYSRLGLVGLGREANGGYGIALQLARPPAKVQLVPGSNLGRANWWLGDSSLSTLDEIKRRGNGVTLKQS